MSEAENIGPIDLPEENFDMPTEFKQDPFIRVYLASGLTGREIHKKLDDRIRSVITEVLEKSRYNGLQYKVYDPERYTGTGSPHSSKEVYRIDFEKVVEADLVIFYLNAPSWGVGYEGQIAAGATIPKILVYPESQKVSRMVLGDFNPVLFSVEFKSEADLAPRFSHKLNVFGKEIIDMASKKRRVFNSHTTIGLAKFIFCRRVRLGKTIDVIARETAIEAHWITMVQLDSRKAAMLTWIQLQRIAEAIQAELGSNENGVVYMREKDEEHLEQSMKQSLDNLYEAYVSYSKVVDDGVLLILWGEYSEHFHSINDTLWKIDSAISKEDWLEKFEQREKAICEEREKSRVVCLLGLDAKKLPETHRKSLDNLCTFLGEVNQISEQNLQRLWKNFKKDNEDKSAARGGNATKMRVYSVEDWRNLFNGLHLQD